jgi:hypothetical protein
MKRYASRWVEILVVVNLLMVAILAIGLFAGMGTVTAGLPAQAEPSPSSSPDVMSMGLAHIPTSNNCLLCHERGGSGGVKPIPAVAHPLEGWRQCLTCHTDPGLGRQAPGHEGIAETECLNCHEVARPGQPITQPHSRLQDQLCLDCHGSYAHLPSSMASKKESTCTVCHKPTALPPPVYPHSAGQDLDCVSCHRSPTVGNLPIDHSLRTNSTCRLCHDIKQAASPPTPGSSPPVVPLPAPSTPPS